MKRSSPRNNQVNIFASLPEALAAMEREYADRPAVTVYEDDQPVTRSYCQLAADVRILAAALQARGLAGKHIGIASENRYQWVVAFWGIVCAGGVAVALDIENPQQALVEMVRHADVAAIFVSAEAEPLFATAKLPLIYFDEENAIVGWQRLMAEGAANLAELPPADTERLALIVYTSGTTSASKAVMLSQRNILHVACYGQLMIDLGERVYVPLPLCHSYSLVCGMLTCLTQGQHICLNGSLKTMLRDLKLFDPGSMLAVPLMVDSLLGAIRSQRQRQGAAAEVEMQRAKRRYLRRVKLGWRPQPYRPASVEAVLGRRLCVIFCGGARLNEAHALEFAVYGIQVVQGYGVSECSPLISVNYVDDNHPASVGHLLADTELRFSEGTEGEISVKSPAVAMGYYKNEELTAQAFTDGWFHTGDLGYMDRDGLLYLRGRNKNLIVFSNGKKVTPEEIERYLDNLPLAKELMVYGAISGQGGDDVKLALIVYPDPELTRHMNAFSILERLQFEVDIINRRLPNYKKIQSIKLTETPFEKTSSRKIRRMGGEV